MLLSGEGFPGGSAVKNLPAHARDMGAIPSLIKFPEEGNDNPLQYSCLENPMVRGPWWATVHGVARVGHDLATKERDDNDDFCLIPTKGELLTTLC